MSGSESRGKVRVTFIKYGWQITHYTGPDFNGACPLDFSSQIALHAVI